MTPSTPTSTSSLSRRGVLAGGAAAAAVPLVLATPSGPASAAPPGGGEPASPQPAAPSPTRPDPAPDSGPFAPGEPWTDTSGEVIQAHGGQVVVHEDDEGPIYYWYGKDRSNGYGNSPGVHGYSSRNLYDWTDEGVVLRTLKTADDLDDDPYFVDLYEDYDDAQREAVVRDLLTYVDEGSEETVAILERPKVLYNDATDTWVLWVHADGPSEESDAQYAKARAGVAVSDSPTGPFRWIDSYRLHVAPEDEENFDPDNPGMARDMTVFKDDDATAYIIYSSEENYSLFISKLDADYTYLATGPDDAVKGVDFIRPYIGAHREAPALFKREGTYYLITSGATGWDPNPASYATATDILGEWTDHGNPCVGEGAGTTFGSQSTNVIPVDPDAGLYIYMGDRWTPDDLANAPYVWLPILFGEGTEITLEDEETWRWEDAPSQPRFEVSALIPKYIRPGATKSLPRRVRVSSDGRTAVRKVDWDGNLERPGLTSATGTFTHDGVELDVTRQVLVVPRRIQYLVSAGGEETSDYLDIRTYGHRRLLNSGADQKYGEDPATGRTWGYTGNTDSAGTGTDSMDRTVRYAQEGSDIRYRFGGLKARTHTVYVCFYEPWPEATNRAAKVTLNGEVIAEDQRFSSVPEVISAEVEVADGEELDLRISPISGADVQVSWVLVAQK